MKSNAALAQIRKAFKVNTTAQNTASLRQAKARWARIAEGKPVTIKLEGR